MNTEIQTQPTDESEKHLNLLMRFFTAPVEVRTYTNLFYLALAFPLGLFYFIFLLTGLALGFGLTIIWIGLPILAVVLAASWGMAALERRLAILLLGAEVPPMTAPATGQPQDFWKRVQEFLGNPVTWKGLGFLFLKFPLGIMSFVLTLTLLVVPAAFLFAPIAWGFDDVYYDIPFWNVDTFGETLILAAFGLMGLLVSLNILNGMGRVWRELAEVMLGSRRFEVPAEQPPTIPPPSPSLPAMLPLS
ncbi:MAG TPA: sensor domain-containing protein [Thermoanaerobaculia bacterium]|nr:sensor domain-containing protein [Thermoanaerobaculia bacterium]